MGGEITLSTILVVAIPVIIAITFHEAAHGYVAWKLGDPTAHEQGRVTFNPFKHVDVFGTIILPGLLLLLRSPFLFGWAKPVPVDPRQLRQPRRDMVLVAAAGPGINLALALVSGIALALFSTGAETPTLIERLLSVSIYINAILAVFNMIPLPPLDGGRVAIGLLPAALAYPLARIEPYGMYILIGVLFVVPLATRPLGYEIDLFNSVVRPIVLWVVEIVEAVTGARMVRIW